MVVIPLGGRKRPGGACERVSAANGRLATPAVFGRSRRLLQP